MAAAECTAPFGRGSESEAGEGSGGRAPKSRSLTDAPDDTAWNAARHATAAKAQRENLDGEDPQVCRKTTTALRYKFRIIKFRLVSCRIPWVVSSSEARDLLFGLLERTADSSRQESALGMALFDFTQTPHCPAGRGIPTAEAGRTSPQCLAIVAPHSSGLTSRACREKSQWWPSRSSAPYCRSPYSVSWRPSTILAPADLALSK